MNQKCNICVVQINHFIFHQINETCKQKSSMSKKYSYSYSSCTNGNISSVKQIFSTENCTLGGNWNFVEKIDYKSSLQVLSIPFPFFQVLSNFFPIFFQVLSIPFPFFQVFANFFPIFSKFCQFLSHFSGFYKSSLHVLSIPFPFFLIF